MLEALRLQSSAMGLAVEVISVFLACFTAANALAPFPHGKTVVYKYYSNVEAGTIEPAPYASQFALEGTLYVEHDQSDLTLKNAFFVNLSDVTIGMYNGKTVNNERTKVFKPINEGAQVIEEPFLIVYDDDGKLQGVKIPENETAWSKNIKMAIASMLQLDIPSMKINEPIEPRSFVSKENTIHGDCWTNYEVNVMDQFHPNDNEFVVTKFSSPINCSGFAIHTFDQVDDWGCAAKKDESVTVASRKLMEIEKNGEEILIKKLIAHGSSNYVPWNARSEAHYVMTNTTLVLDKAVSTEEISLQPLNFLNVQLTHDLTYRKPKKTDANNSAIDLTQGRHVVDSEIAVSKLKKLLEEAADYLEENHLKTEEPDWKHGQTLNRILHTMSYMNVESLERVFNYYESFGQREHTTIKDVYRQMLPQVGTTASCIFILSLIRDRKIPDSKLSAMLLKMPQSVKAPNEQLLNEMEHILSFGHNRSISLRRAGILSFSSLIYRTFKDVPNPEENPLFQRHLQYFFDQVMNERDYRMKIVHLMALKNIQVGKVYELLAQIIRGDVAKSKDSMHLRLLAIWAIERSIRDNYSYARDLLWPLMANKKLPVKHRIAAYEILIHQAPSMSDVLRIYWFMVNESNEHLYNYHYTTIKGIANSVDPCKHQLRDAVRKIMRFTRIHKTVPYSLSTAYSFDYNDEKYNHGEKINAGMIVNELSGVPEVLKFERFVNNAGRVSSKLAVRLHIEGSEGIMSFLARSKILNSGSLSNPNVLEILRKAANEIPNSEYLHIDAITERNGRVASAMHFDELTWLLFYDEFEKFIKTILQPPRSYFTTTRNSMVYDSFYEKQVTSEMGLPVVFASRVPRLTSYKIYYQIPGAMWTLRFSMKFWRHGDNSMSIYNPIADVWHSVRRTTATDALIPINMYWDYNWDTQRGTITFQHNRDPNLNVAGIRRYVKDSVTIDEDDQEELKKSCATCNNEEVVSLGFAKKKYSENSYDSPDTGLRYSTSIFDCESGFTPAKMISEWHRAFMSEGKNDGNSWIVRGLLAIRQQMKNMLISPEMGSCGRLLKIEPSEVYPTDHIDIGVRLSSEDLHHNGSSINFGSKKYNVHGDIKVSSDVKYTRFWDYNITIAHDRGRFMNNANIQLTRKTPGETNLQICVDARKSYDTLPADSTQASDLNFSREETNSKLTIAIGHSNENKCVRNETLITMTVKGQLSDKQKKQRSEEIANSACSKDRNNSLYANPKNIVPKTLNCLIEDIKYSTLRKYTIDVSHEKVPQNVTSKLQYYEDILRAYFLPNLKYTNARVDDGNMRINVEFPVENEGIDFSMVTPTRSFDLVGVDFRKQGFNGFGPVFKPVWQFPLDNTRFSIVDLMKYNNDMLKLCSIYPKNVLTGDGTNFPFNISEKWTLVSGDHLNETFAVFAKMIDENMALKIYVRDHEVEIIAKDDAKLGLKDSVEVMVDGEIVHRLMEGIIVPDDINTWILRITKDNDSVIFEMKDAPLTIVYGINHVGLIIDTVLQGKVSGLCGHLDGTHQTEIPQFYTMQNP